MPNGPAEQPASHWPVAGSTPHGSVGRPVPHDPSGRPRRVTLTKDGPILVEGPVEVVLDDGSTAVSDRFTVALCVCRRSRSFPWCDTSHRSREKRRTA
ncbi:CDGSH iron-sulfur domain-containing protein [Streptomyces sp. NBC_00690]|uniref:CDGSH iron-sulfur domain-containing protein n=1 Tax=Streptomyces sp. NBC_00690 TaxID=2975808 RepID=UPI003FA73EE7